MPDLTYIMPGFIVSSLETALSFYQDKLGFELRYIGPDDDPFWAIVGLDQVSIMLKAVTPDTHPVPNRSLHPWAPWDAYISTEDPDSLFEEYQALELNFPRPLKNDDDNLRGFEVLDPDGYVLFFGRPVRTEASIPAFKKMSPQIPVTHIDRAIDFYTKKLGFSLDFRYQDFYAGILKDGHSIHLKARYPQEKNDTANEDLDMTFSVDNIEDLYNELQNRSVGIVQPLRQMPYGREFYIADPDGNRIAFLEI